MPFTLRLFHAVSVTDLSQDNICCLNTAVLFFVRARVSGSFDDFFATWAQAERDEENSDQSADAFIDHVVPLLDIWYAPRGCVIYCMLIGW